MNSSAESHRAIPTGSTKAIASKDFSYHYCLQIDRILSTCEDCRLLRLKLTDPALSIILRFQQAAPIKLMPLKIKTLVIITSDKSNDYCETIVTVLILFDYQ